MKRMRPLPALLLAAALVMAAAFPAAAAPASFDGTDSAGPWSLLVQWLSQAHAGLAATWSSFSTGGTGDVGLGLDPDGTDPDDGDGSTDGGTEEPPPDDGTTTEPAPSP